MFNLGPFELVAIFVVALLVFGPDKLPEMGRQVGKAVKEFRKFQASMQGQVRDVLEPITGPDRPQRRRRPAGRPTSGADPLPEPATTCHGRPRSRSPRPTEGEEAAPPGTLRALRPPRSSPPAADAGAGDGDDAPTGEATPPAAPADPESR